MPDTPIIFSPMFQLIFVVSFALIAGALLFLLYYQVGYKVAKLIFRKASSKK